MRIVERKVPERRSSQHTEEAINDAEEAAHGTDDGRDDFVSPFQLLVTAERMNGVPVPRWRFQFKRQRWRRRGRHDEQRRHQSRKRSRSYSREDSPVRTKTQNTRHFKLDNIKCNILHHVLVTRETALVIKRSPVRFPELQVMTEATLSEALNPLNCSPGARG